MTAEKTPGQVAYEARQAAKGRRMGADDDTPDSEIVAVIGLGWDELPAGMQADEEAGAQAAILKLRDAFDLLAKVTAGQERALYATWIEFAQHKSRDAALRILNEALDGYDGPEWNGTESGVGWLERTRRAALAATDEGEQRAADLRAHVSGMGGPSPAWVTDDAAGVAAEDDDGERDTARRMDALDEAARLEAGL